MSELLDAFDDEGLFDIDTRNFLVEALSNSGSDEWRDILQPFVEPETALSVLNNVPNVLERSLKALAPKEDLTGPVAGSTLSNAVLDTLPSVLPMLGLYTVAKCSELCCQSAAKLRGV